jgi:glutamate racemase
VLGCTHYPLLTGVIQIVMGDAVTLVSSAEETVKDVVRLLTERDEFASEPPVHRVTCTGPPERFAKLAARFLPTFEQWG